MTEYPWYTTVHEEDGLQQGDLLVGCPVTVPPARLAGEEVIATIRSYNVVVMSQSCDLMAGKIRFALLCPCWTLGRVAAGNPEYRSAKAKDKLRRGEVVGYHLLNKCDVPGFPAFTGDYLVVDFRNIFSVDLSFLLQFTQDQGPRIRLLPPYREHLSQAFARFFMRVGLPADIPAFTR